MLHLHRAERADALADALRDLLAEPLGDPFAQEVVSVPTRGIERWLSQRLSHGLGVSDGRQDGVCANVDFPPPGRLVADAIAAGSSVDPRTDPWRPERAVWPLLALTDELPADIRADHRLSVVRHIAELFDRYALHRPEMLQAWAAGDDAGIRQDARWQPALWRALHTAIGPASPAERLEQACNAIVADQDLLELPPRLSLFGLTRLPAGHLRVLRAIAAGRDVHLFLLHPSPGLWDAIATVPPSVERRAQDPTATLPRNRLLSSWGRDAREMQLVLGTGFEDHHHDAELNVTSQLHHLQAAIRADGEATDLPAADGSIQVHACHGRGRQVDVLRDAILHAFDEDSSLEPRDVIVMCPDIETFAPLIHATFGAGEVSDEREGIELRVRLADRSLRQTNPILGAVSELLSIAGGRVTASQVLDFTDRSPARRRFGFDDDALTRLREWVAQAGIRWGLDAHHRAPFHMATEDAGTWQRGIGRLLLGVTMTEDERRLYHGVLPVDDVESGAIDLVGRFAELTERLRQAVDRFSEPMPIDDWAEAIAEIAQTLTATSERDSWQHVQLQRLLDDVVAEAAGNDTQLSLAELRALLAERLQGRPTRANFRTGHLTVCTLVPMRSVPHRVVCLLGLDDGAFPRKGIRDGDDLMLADPHVGERDPRAEDRQLLLDALLAARDRLIITYTGNDERTNEERPPAVPVGELLDVTGKAVVQRHPLQPFDRRNFAASAPWSFDPVMLAAARASAGPRERPGAFVTNALPPLTGELVELETLVRFVQHPVRTFLRERLQISLVDYTTDTEDGLRIELDGLQRWGVGQRLVDALMAGIDGRDACLAELARGDLPPGELGKPVIDAVFPLARDIAGAVAQLAPTEPSSMDVRLTLRDERMLAGTVAGVRGAVLLSATYSRLAPKHRLAAWVRLLALAAGYSDRDWSAVSVGRGKDGIAIATLRAPESPIGQLAVLVDLLDRGLREPLPLVCETSAAYVKDGIKAATGKWATAYNFDGEDAEPEHELAFGGRIPFGELLSAPPGSDELWTPGEEPRFGQLAKRLWSGLLAHEKVTEQ
jgi:exodeoxyribonuclease V gamma subunit